MHLSVATLPSPDGRYTGVRFRHRFRRLGATGGAAALFNVSILVGDGAGAWTGVQGHARAGLRAGARFLIDAVYGVTDASALARMIGCFTFAWSAEQGQQVVEVTLRNDRGLSATARLRRPIFQVERNGFGAAHILFENDVLGLYVLELAPGETIPAHFHRVMQESELVLDPGLLQQGRPVGAGNAFVWPAGRVHEYANPTGAPKRILCIDRPKFIPEDEVLVTAPAKLARARSERNYLV